jgi:beta-glucanase (GH16 family)
MAGMALAAASLSIGQAATGWTLVWSDEFQQADGSVPDPSKWVYDLGGNGWGNNELQTYTSRTNNARIEDGRLVIEARQETYTGTDGIQRNYTSARLKTLGKVSWAYGRIEARIKVPRGQGLWPAFWMLGTNFPSAGWPACGEIDIMENIGAEPSIVHGTIHGPGYSGGGSIGNAYTLSGGAAFADDFHLFAVEWETNRIRWYADNHLYFTATPSSLPGGSQWVFTQPQFVILNVAVGGTWPGNPDGTTTFPQRMTVDYVRVYAATNVAACGGNALPNPGFETGGLAGWTIYGAGFNTLLENSNNVPVHGGSNVFKVFGQFTGGDNYSGAFGDFTCSSGDTFTANGWALTPVGDQIAGGNTAWIEVTFRDVSANMLALYRSPEINSGTTPGSWLNLAVTNQLNPVTFAVIGSTNQLVAPAGVSFARFQTVFRQPLMAAGAVLFDDLNFQLAGGIIPPVPASAGLSGGNLNLSFPTFLGLNYQVSFKNDLADANWLVLTNLTGDGSTMTVADAIVSSRRFYQVARVCD